MNDFSTPQRMSAGAFVILLLQSLKAFGGATFIGLAILLSRHNEETGPASVMLMVAGIFGGILAVALLAAFMNYYFRKFHIAGDKLIFTRGFASKETAEIPLARVHALRTKRGLFYRILGMRSVSFDTLAGDGQEVELILDEDDWQRLLAHVDSEVQPADSAASRYTPEAIAMPISEMPAADGGETVRISNANIIKGALCQNHLKGFAVLVSVLLPFLDKIYSLGEDITSGIIDYIDSHAAEMLVSVSQWIIFLFMLYLFVMLLWTGKVALRYGNMSLRFDGGRLTVDSGLLSRFTCRFDRDKVTVVTIKENPFEKLAGCQTITLRQAENATENKIEGDIRIYGSRLSGRLLAWWLSSTDGSGSADTALLTAASGAGVFVRRFLPQLIVAAAATAVICHFAQSYRVALTIGTAYTLFATVRAFMAWKHSSVTLHENCVELSCGNVARISRYMKYRDIETIVIRCTPFTRFTRRVSLEMATNADTATICSLDIVAARAIRNHILTKSASL